MSSWNSSRITQAHHQALHINVFLGTCFQIQHLRKQSTTSAGEQDCISHHNDQLGLLMRQKAAFDQHAGHSMLHTGICVRQCKLRRLYEVQQKEWECRILKHHRKWQCTALHATLKSDMQRPDSMWEDEASPELACQRRHSPWSCAKERQSWLHGIWLTQRTKPGPPNICCRLWTW